MRAQTELAAAWSAAAAGHGAEADRRLSAAQGQLVEFASDKPVAPQAGAALALAAEIASLKIEHRTPPAGEVKRMWSESASWTGAA